MYSNDPGSSAILRGLFEGLSFGCLVDREGCILLLNRAAVETSSLHPDALIGRRFSETPWWQGSQKARRRLDRGMKLALAGQQASFHADLVMVDERKLMEVTLTPVREDDQTIPSLVVSATDIGERQAIASQLQESEERFREVTHSASFLVWMSDENGEFTFVNRPWLDFTGRCLEHELGQGWRTAIHPADRRRCLDAYRVGIELRQTFAVECRFRDLRRVDRWFAFRGGPRYRPDGVLTGFMGVCTGIDDQKRLESELRASLQEKELLLREVHHRVKNNLQVVSSLLRLQSRTADHPEAVRILEESEHRLQAMALVHETIYRSESGRVGASQYLRSLIEHLRRLYASSLSAVLMDCHFDDLDLDLDEAIPLALIVNELVSNSLKHAFDDKGEGACGTVRVALLVEPRRVLLEVEDDGVGIPEGVDWLEVESLGMRLVHLLGRQLGADVEVTSSPRALANPRALGSGTRVRLVRPHQRDASGGP